MPPWDKKTLTYCHCMNPQCGSATINLDIMQYINKADKHNKRKKNSENKKKIWKNGKEKERIGKINK